MKFNFIFVGISVMAMLCSCGGRKGATPVQAPPQTYPAVVVNAEHVTLLRTFPTIIRGQEDIEIRPRVDGFIDQIYIDEGSVVRKGQSLFKINSPSSEQALVAAQSGVATAQATLNTAQLNVDRMRPLAEKGIISNVQLQTNENQYESAQATFAQAQSTLAQAQATIGWTTVTSPVDGIAGTLPYRQGSLVNSQNVLTTVANTGNVFAYFSINEKVMLEMLEGYPGATQAEKIKNMPKVSLVLADGTEYPEKGTIQTISGVVNVSTGSANFRAEFPNNSSFLRSGMSGKISIPREVDGVFVIPQKATFAQQDKTLVYKAQGDTVAVQAIITVEAMPDGINYAVTGGLNAGDKVITDGVATLANGKKIKVD